MGSSSSPKVQVSEYRMSLHLGFCHAVDYLLEIFVKEKSVWRGVSSSNQAIGIVKPSLFGGVKKEGGLVGTIEVMHGRDDQVAGDLLAGKLGTTSAQAPGFRDYLSLLFHGGSQGFLWSANYPYLHPVWAKVSRASSGWYGAKSRIGDSLSVNPDDYTISGSTSLPVLDGRYPVPVKVVGRTLHFSYAVRCPSVYIGSPEMPKVPLYFPEHYVLDMDTGNIVDTYYAPVRRYLSYNLSADGVFFDYIDPNINYSHVMKLGDKQLWLIYRSAPDIYAHLTLAFDGFNPDTGTSFVALDMATERVAGVAIDQKAEVVLVIISKPTTGTSRWVELTYDAEVMRKGTCDFYAQTRTPEAQSGGATSWIFGYGPSESRIWTTTYCYDTWTVASYSTRVYFFQIDQNGVLRYARDIILPPTSHEDRFSYFNGTSLYVGGSGSPGAVETITPTVGSSTAAGPQMNPAHIIREALTNIDWGLGIDESLIDDASFMAAADTLYDEGFGLSLQWAGQSTAEDFINDILAHIDATYGTDPETGKFYLKLIRGDYDADTLDELTEDDLTITSFTRNALSDTNNEVVVTWTNPENEEEQTVTVHDIANYSSQGVVISTSRNYHAVRTSELALRCAMRELAKASQPVATFEVEANRLAIGYKSGDVIKVTYQEYGLSGLPCRVMSINRGKPGEMAVKMTLMEDVFDMPAGAYVVSPGTEWEDATDDTMPINVYRVASAPYYLVAKELGDYGASVVEYPETYAMVLATGPGAEYSIYTQRTDTLGNPIYAAIGSREYAGTATLTFEVGIDVTSPIIVSGLTATPEAGMLFFIGDELCVVEQYVGETIVARRGMLDTVPAAHPVGERLWFFTEEDDIADPGSRTVGQTISYKLVPEGQSAGEAVLVSEVMTDRMYRPYRPANVKVNGAAWPTVVAGDVTVSWSHRNRLLETSVLNKWDEASVTPETGTTYTIRFYDASDTLLHTATGITGDSYTWATGEAWLRFELESVRDGYTSYQVFEHSFDLAGYGRNYGNYYGGI